MVINIRIGGLSNQGPADDVPSLATPPAYNSIYYGGVDLLNLNGGEISLTNDDDPSNSEFGTGQVPGSNPATYGPTNPVGGAALDTLGKAAYGTQSYNSPSDPPGVSDNKSKPSYVLPIHAF